MGLVPGRALVSTAPDKYSTPRTTPLQSCRALSSMLYGLKIAFWFLCTEYRKILTKQCSLLCVLLSHIDLPLPPHADRYALLVICTFAVTPFHLGVGRAARTTEYTNNSDCCIYGVLHAPLPPRQVFSVASHALPCTSKCRYSIVGLVTLLVGVESQVEAYARKNKVGERRDFSSQLDWVNPRGGISWGALVQV